MSAGEEYSPEYVGKEFVSFFYEKSTCVDTVEELKVIYRESAVLCLQNNGVKNTYTGPEEVVKALTELGIDGVGLEDDDLISMVGDDKDCIHILVAGTLNFAHGNPDRKFIDSFTLKREDDMYAVQAHILRILDPETAETDVVFVEKEEEKKAPVAAVAAAPYPTVEKKKDTAPTPVAADAASKKRRAKKSSKKAAAAPKAEAAPRGEARSWADVASAPAPVAAAPAPVAKAAAAPAKKKSMVVVTSQFSVKEGKAQIQALFGEDEVQVQGKQVAGGSKFAIMSTTLSKEKMVACAGSLPKDAFTLMQ